MNENRIDVLLAAAPVEPLPLGFRADVMRRVSQPRSVAWEWIAAAALALPSLAYVAWVVASSGGDFVSLLGELALVAQGTEDAGAPTFFIDGLIVLAVALLGLGSAVAAHALVQGGGHGTRRTPSAG